MPKQFVPLPLWVFEALPTLSGAEIALLLAVARATLGWSEGAKRKERDWLSHRQLAQRTGRGATSLSQALHALVQRGLLVAQTETGAPLDTPAKRRGQRGRIYYGLTSNPMMDPMNRQHRTSEREDLEREDPEIQEHKIREHENRGVQESQGQQPFTKRLRESENENEQQEWNAANRSETGPNDLTKGENNSLLRLQKTATTRETGTREIKNNTLKNNTLSLDLLLLESGNGATVEFGAAEIERLSPTPENEGQSQAIASEDTATLAAAVPMPSTAMPSAAMPATAMPTHYPATERENDAERFLAHFEAAYRQARPNRQMPAVEAETIELLRKRLRHMTAAELERWLPRFFACRYGYVARRDWSLQSYLECVYTLQTQHGRRVVRSV